MHSAHHQASEAARASEERVRALQNIANGLRQNDGPMSSKERPFLEHSIKFLESFNKYLTDFIRQEEENIRRTKEEIQKYSPEQSKNDKVLDEIKGSIGEIENKMRILEENKRIISLKKREIANQIVPMELANIKFKDFQAESNDVFRWCISAVYAESKANYEWSNFKKQVFKQDKGSDFLDRLRGLNLAKLKKDDFVFAKSVTDKKEAYLDELAKGNTNPSLRRYMEFMEAVVSYGLCNDETDKLKGELEEKQKILDKKTVEFQKVASMSKMLEQKIADSTYYVETLNKLKASIPHQMSDVEEKIKNPNKTFPRLGDSQSNEERQHNYKEMVQEGCSMF